MAIRNSRIGSLLFRREWISLPKLYAVAVPLQGADTIQKLCLSLKITTWKWVLAWDVRGVATIINSALYDEVVKFLTRLLQLPFEFSWIRFWKRH